jgi:hypothetical protein
MDSVTSAMDKFDDVVRKNSGWLENKYIAAGLSLLLILYASLAAPKLPYMIARLFDYTIVKVIMFFMLVYISRKDPTIALIAAVGVLVSLMALDRIKIQVEMMSVVSPQ